MYIPEEAQQVLDFCEPLPSDCFAYLDFTTLGSESARDDLIEIFADHHREQRGPNRTTTPRTYARRIVDPLDDVTVNLLRHELWEPHYGKTLGKVRRESQVGLHRVSGMRIRNYLLLMLSARDLEQRSGTQRQFHGLHEVTFNEETGLERLEYFNLGTNDAYRSYVALFRYAVAVSNGVEFSDEYKFFVPRDDDALVIYPEVRELILEHPNDADRMARIVIERGSQSMPLLRSVLAEDATPVLDSGVL